MAKKKIAPKPKRSKKPEAKPASTSMTMAELVKEKLTAEEIERVEAAAPPDLGPTLTLGDVHELLGTNYIDPKSTPTATWFAIQALDDVTRTLSLVIEALHEGVDHKLVEDVVSNAYFRAGCARDIAIKHARGAS